MRTALWVEPAAGTTSSNAFRETSQYTGSGVFRPNGHTPPTSWPVISATSCTPSIFGLPPNSALTFLLSIRAVPLATISTTRSPIRSDSVFAIRPGSTPWASAASATVAELIGDSMTAISGAFSAKNARTDSRLMSGDQIGQFRQRVDAIVGLKSEFVHLGADRLEHCERGDDVAFDTDKRHRFRRHPLDPGDVQPERLGAAGIPGVRRHEQHFGRRHAQRRFDQAVGIRRGLEDLLGVDADGGIQIG